MSFLSKKNISILLLIKMLSATSFFLHIKQVYLVNNGISIEIIGIGLIIYQICSVVFEIPTGVVGDKYGKRNSVLIGQLFLLISLVLLLDVNNYKLIISFFILGVGKTFISGSDSSLLYEESEVLGKEGLKKISVYGSYIWFIGYGIGVTVALPLSSLIGITNVLYLSIGFQIFSMLLLTMIKNKKPEEHQEITLFGNIKIVLKNREFLFFILMSTLYMFVDIPFEDFALLHVIDKGMNPIYASIPFGVIHFMSPISKTLGLYFKDKHRNFILKYFLFFALLCFIPMVIFDSKIVFFTFLAISNILFGIRSLFSYVYVNSLLENKYRATAYSFISLVMSAYAIFGLLIYSFIFKYFNSYDIALLSITVIAVILTLYLLVFKVKLKESN